MFSGFTDRTFEFFMAIRFNNNRAFFQENHAWYVSEVRDRARSLAAALSPLMERIDGAMETRPERVVSRLNRDVRFSNDKSPYRDYLWIAFHRPNDERACVPGFYFDMSCDGASYGMGMYGPNKPLMNAFRRVLTTDPARVSDALAPSLGAFSPHADAYKRMAVPENVPETLRAWYPLRSFYMEKEIKDFSLIKSPALADEMAGGFEALAPLYTLLTALTPEEDAQ